MIRGNRLVIPVGREICCQTFGVQMGDMGYRGDSEQRIELSLEECEAIIAKLPVIIQFVIIERGKEVKK